MENYLLSGLPPLSNAEGSFLGVDVVDGLKSYTVFLSLDSRYCGNFKQNCSCCIVSFIICLLSREALRLIYNLKN